MDWFIIKPIAYSAIWVSSKIFQAPSPTPRGREQLGFPGPGGGDEWSRAVRGWKGHEVFAQTTLGHLRGSQIREPWAPCFLHLHPKRNYPHTLSCRKNLPPLSPAAG